ncbi:hypothetical protein A2121_02010 [Candidatus Nomurabacteria bacterium GWB1_40_6]|uniref:RNA polymerase sigma factor 70 region 4 type 2 domain-containing protein n=1 Tax=Candidatus Nomurabacteria bacterium GWB1_40_6 TaxID=1801727 RepID=A0A1F6TNP5_9BACT|nr:MAG: hypothetical protein A2121_02010 [Candidatus Nomurabacteria bacterium GWB1_40_6]
MAKISNHQINLVRKLYYGEKLTMLKIAQKLGVSIDAVVYCMRKNKIKRRSLIEANVISFQNKKLSFNEQVKLSPNKRQLKLIGLMLYWGEGYKTKLSHGVDFANSDPEMVAVFVKFLRIIYKINEKRLRVLLYCYADQDVQSLINYWSKLTKISKTQFTKPYIRKDFRENGRKMKYGMVHIRYADKKLFLSIMKSVEEIKLKMRRW